MGQAVTFNNSLATGTALDFTSPSEIDVFETGYYHIAWEVYGAGYDVAFAMFLDAVLVPGSNYGAQSNDGIFQGRLLAHLTEGGTLTLNRFDNLYSHTLSPQISGVTPVISTSIILIKIA